LLTPFRLCGLLPPYLRTFILITNKPLAEVGKPVQPAPEVADHVIGPGTAGLIVHDRDLHHRVPDAPARIDIADCEEDGPELGHIHACRHVSGEALTCMKLALCQPASEVEPAKGAHDLLG
jgi:hypothetical protein